LAIEPHVDRVEWARRTDGTLAVAAISFGYQPADRDGQRDNNGDGRAARGEPRGGPAGAALQALDPRKDSHGRSGGLRSGWSGAPPAGGRPGDRSNPVPRRANIRRSATPRSLTFVP